MHVITMHDSASGERVLVMLMLVYISSGTGVSWWQESCVGNCASVWTLCAKTANRGWNALISGGDIR